MEENLKEQIEAVVAEAAEQTGFSVYDVNMFLSGEKSRLVVTIDHEKAISHDDCEKYTRVLNNLLGEKELLTSYYLEVSSPGINRKLRDLADYQRFVNSPVKIVHYKDEKVYTDKGILKTVNDSCLVLVSEDNNKEKEINLSDIKKANLAY